MNSLQIDTNLTFDPNTLIVNQSLNIANSSQQELAFKIKTNHKNLVSMYINHGFIKPYSSMSIPVKIVEQVDQNVTIKLQVNWCKATPQMKQKNDSKMATVSKENIFKKVFPILRKAETQEEILNRSGKSQEKNPLYESVYEQKKNQKQQKVSTFTPQRENKEPQLLTPQKIPATSQSDRSQKDQPKGLYYQSISPVLPTKNLEIVSQEDEDDHQKQLQQIKNEQIQQRRRLDEVRVKVRRINEEMKSKQFIDIKLLALLLISSFTIGSFLQNFLF